MSDTEEAPLVKMDVTVLADFNWANDPLNKIEEESRKLSSAVLKQAALKVEPIARQILTELLEAQVKHYITEQPK